MPDIDQAQTIARLAAGDVGNTNDKGQALEEVVRDTMCLFEGVTVLRMNAEDIAGSSEIDILLSNMRYPQALGFLPEHILVECKNWQAPVDTATLRVFTSKLREYRLDFGILVAANGITGHGGERTAAHAHLRQVFNSDGIKVVVLSRAELEALTHTDELDALLRAKYGAAIMGFDVF